MCVGISVCSPVPLCASCYSSILQRDKEVVSKLFTDIEQNTLRNIKEKSLREQQRQDAPDEQEELEESLEREQAGMDTALPEAVYQETEEEVDGAGHRELQEDPFEVVAPVASEHAKPDEKERSLDAVLEFEHSLEEDQMEGEESCPLGQQQEGSSSALVEGGFLLDEPYVEASHLETSVKDVSSDQHTGGESAAGCTTADGWEMTERHIVAEAPPPHTADLLLNHDTGDDVMGTVPDVPHTGTAHNSTGPWLQGGATVPLYAAVVSLLVTYPPSLTVRRFRGNDGPLCCE